MAQRAFAPLLNRSAVALCTPGLQASSCAPCNCHVLMSPRQQHNSALDLLHGPRTCIKLFEARVAVRAKRHHASSVTSHHQSLAIYKPAQLSKAGATAQQLQSNCASTTRTMQAMMEDAEKYEAAWAAVREAAGVVIPGGFGVRGVEGKIAAAKYCRESRTPFLGICLGMQVRLRSSSQRFRAASEKAQNHVLYAGRFLVGVHALCKEC